MNTWTELQQQVRYGLLGLLDHVRGPVDGVLGDPVGEVLLHHSRLPVDDGEHEGGEPGLGGDGEELPALRDESVGVGYQVRCNVHLPTCRWRSS